MSGLQLLVTDGPCVGSYDALRARPMMAFTVDRFTGQRFVLDQDGDRIEETEDAYVYATDGAVGWLCGGGRTTRTVTYHYAGKLDPGTGEFLAASRPELEMLRRGRNVQLLAWARGEQPRVPAGPPVTVTPTGEPQGALFT